MMSAHTRTPWAVATEEHGEGFVGIGPLYDEPRADFYEDTIAEFWGDNHDARANATITVLAVNSYAELLPALKTAREWLTCVESPLSDTTAFKRDLAAIDRAITLGTEPAP